ncbi:hypothetical protein ABT160_16440 [Streptomyces sp. NPDC001941]|uniref:hypothetical protein n=1 Tax=Streptomyces sp. NPDC001941 TaxID=3154659 RepID=UPI00332D647F
MRLVHVRIRCPEGELLPTNAAQLIGRSAREEDGVEHVAVHSDAENGPVVGLFLAGPGAVEAERVAEGVCRRALAEHDELAGFVLTLCRIAPVLAFEGETRVPNGAGRLRSVHDPSTENLFHPF